MYDVNWPLLALFIVLILLALFGNLLVCAAILWDRSLRKQPENLFLVSLAVSDLLVSILVMIFAAANDILGYWPFREFYCRFWISFDITCCTASILNLCAISLDRYWHISRPMVYIRYCNRRRINYVIIIVWLISAAIGAAPLGFGYAQFIDKSSNSTSSDYPMCAMALSMPYAITSSFLSFFLPAAVMVILYTKLYLYARKHVRSIKTQLQQATSFLIMQLASEKIREVTAATLKGEALLAPDSPSTERTAMASSTRTPAVRLHGGSRRSTTTTTVTLSTPKRENYGLTTTTTTTSTNMPPLNKVESIRTSVFSKLSFLCPSRFKSRGSAQDQHTPSTQHRSNISDQKARLTLGVIMGTFLLCWTPFFIINILRPCLGNINPSIYSAVTWLGYANSSANPLIYSIFNRDFRRAFKKIIINIFGCCWEEPDLNKSISSRFAPPEIERRRSCTKSSESNNDNNNIEHGNATRLTLLANNNDEVIVEEN